MLHMMHHPASSAARPAPFAPGPSGLEGLGEDHEPLVLRHLSTPAQIKEVLVLRKGIDLTAHEAAGAAFFELEKKETSWVSSAHSNAVAV